MITYHERADLFTFPSGARAHGCNTRGAAGGLAGEVFSRLPEMHYVYKHACANGIEAGDMIAFQEDSGTWWYNLMSQVEAGPDAKVEYIVESLTKAVAHAETHGVATLTIPAIGAGIGGLKFADVRAALYEEFMDSTFHIQCVTRGRFSEYEF